MLGLQRLYDMLHPKYQKYFRERVSSHSEGYKRQWISFLTRLPPPEELTKQWVLGFIEQPSKRDGNRLSNDTIRQYLTKIQLIAIWLGEDVTKDIPRPKKRLLQRSDIPEEDEALHIVRCAPSEMVRAYLHILTEHGVRADEALSIRIEDIRIARTTTRVIDSILDNKRVSGRMWKVEISR
ncbi:MAG: hypothetical protein ACXAB9_15055, partial [Candidatus Thorarchaeota archaeon]